MEREHIDVSACYRLLAEVYRQAVRDAVAGRFGAELWLDYTYPEWKDMYRRQPATKAKRVRRQRERLS